MSSTSSSPETYARLSPSWPGASSAWATARGEWAVKTGPSPDVDGSALPSQNRSVNGRWRSAAASSARSGSVVEAGVMATR